MGTVWRSALSRYGLPLVLLAPFVLGATAQAEPPPPVEEFTVTDPRIVESSGLTVQDIDGERIFTTVNDSGDSGQVFVLDPTTGETVGVTTWKPDPRDVEALAPDGDHVWVGDIGDNLRARDHVTVTRLPVGRGERHEAAPVSYDLVYPDRARDAETLLRHPDTGQLFVVSKSVLAGHLWAAPLDLSADAPNELVDLGPLPAIITDGSFTADGEHLVLRSYTHAWVYTFPDLEMVSHFELPKQPQGEGLAVSVDGEVFVSTEGRDRPVLRVDLPADASRALRPVPVPWFWRVTCALFGQCLELT